MPLAIHTHDHYLKPSNCSRRRRLPRLQSRLPTPIEGRLAAVYRYEAPCAAVLNPSSIPRSDLFFTSKVPPRSMGYTQAKESIGASFAQTGLDYIDLYLIHAPFGGREGRLGAWRALVEAQQAGKIRSLGVSNYGVHHLDEFEAYIKELEAEKGKGKGGIVSVGQWELHPWLARPDIVGWCQERGVIIQAYSPLVRAKRFDEPAIQSLVKKYSKTPAQILVRWTLQKGFVPLPMSVTHSRIDENANVYDFEFTAKDMTILQTDDYAPCGWDPTTSKD